MPIVALGDSPLTSFTQDLDAIGMRLARMVLAKLGGATEPLQDLVEARLIPRESDGPAL